MAKNLMWVCLKIVYPIVPNGCADHYPYEKLLFHWEYTLFSDNPMFFPWQNPVLNGQDHPSANAGPAPGRLRGTTS